MSFTAEQLEERRGYLTITDVRALICPNKFESPLTVWLQKCRPGTLVDSAGWPAEMGTAMEPVIANWYARTVGGVVREPPLMTWKEPWLRGNGDRIHEDKYGTETVLEIKRPTNHTRHDWANGPPMKYIVQLTGYMGLSGIHKGDIVAAIGDDEPVIHSVPFDAGLFESMVEVGREFWFNNVLDNTPPEVDGSSATLDALKAMFPKSLGKKLLDPTEEDLDDGKKLAMLKSQINAMELEESNLQARLCARIGQNDGIRGVATWANRKGVISWAKAAEAAGVDTIFAEDFRGADTRTFNLKLKHEGDC